jgi:hypothetical protein
VSEKRWAAAIIWSTSIAFSVALPETRASELTL